MCGLTLTVRGCRVWSVGVAWQLRRDRRPVRRGIYVWIVLPLHVVFAGSHVEGGRVAVSASHGNSEEAKRTVWRSRLTVLDLFNGVERGRSNGQLYSSTISILLY